MLIIYNSIDFSTSQLMDWALLGKFKDVNITTDPQHRTKLKEITVNW